MTHPTSTHPTKTMPNPQIQVHADRIQLKSIISRAYSPEDFLIDVAKIFNDLGADTKRRAAKLAEKDPLLEQWSERSFRYSTAIVNMIDRINETG